MSKPIPLTSVTIQLPDNLSEEDKQKIIQATIQQLHQEQAQKQRDWEMYEKGRRDGRASGFFGGLL